MSRNAGTCTTQRETPAARRRQGKAGEARAARRGMKLAGAELDELVIASALVPTGAVCKPYIDSDTLSTAVPSSAEQSPELNCMVSETDHWPSLREAELNDWDFCCEGEELWEDLPEPAVPVDMPESEQLEISSPNSDPVTSWLLVPGSADTAEPAESEEAPKMTFADKLREQQSGQTNDAVPPAAGTSVPATRRGHISLFDIAWGFDTSGHAGISLPIRARPLQRRTGNGQAGDSQGQASRQTIDDGLADTRQHGWTREHKSSWNTKQQRKVAGREARRNEQSWKSRGWLEEDEQAEV